MQRIRLHRLTLALAFGLAALNGMADETCLSAKHHPWGTFDPGAWKTVRVIAETLNEQGHVVSTNITDTTTTLVDIDNEGVTLEIRACMEVAGKHFQTEPQTAKQGFHGESLGPHLATGEPTKGEVSIEGRKIPCWVRVLESVVPNGKTVTTIYYSTTIAPYVLKRETVTTDPEGKEVLTETASEVTALSAPLKVLGEAKTGIKLKTVHRNGNGTTTTLADILPEIPGGVVANSCRELDKNGRLVRRSTLEIRAYSTDPAKGLFRSRKRHHSKPSPYYDP